MPGFDIDPSRTVTILVDGPVGDDRGAGYGAGMRLARYDLADPDFPVSLVEADEPVLPGPAWARVSVQASGICGSDLHNLYPDGSGSRIFGPHVEAPMEMGHEMAGVVIEAGPECPFAVGTMVAVDPTLTCDARGVERCPACATGATSACWNLGSKLFTGGFGIGFTVGLGGGWGDQLVAHASQLHAVPAGVDARTAALTEPLSVSLHALARRLPPKGAPVLVIGAGIIGLTAVVALRSLAPDSEITVLARHPHQAAAATALGAPHVVRPDDAGEYLAELARLGGGMLRGKRDGATISGGYPLTIEAVGTGASVGLSFRVTAQRGAVILIGGIAVTKVDLAALWFKEIEVVGAFCHAVDTAPDGVRHSFDRALDLLAAGALPADRVVTHEYPLSDLRAACATAHDKSTGAIKVLLHPGS